VKAEKMETEIKLEQFIGIFPNAVNDELCSEYVRWFDLVSEQGLTMSANQDDLGVDGRMRTDELIHIPNGLVHSCFPNDFISSFWKILKENFEIYSDKYLLNEPLSSYGFKVHRVHPSGGYHAWHHEHGFMAPYRVLAWMAILEAPARGGETEFLFQSLRIEPKVGQLMIWPAAFTHLHRGNPPLEGNKTYITGWFDVLPPPQQQQQEN